MINPHDRIRGAADIPLTSEGHAQVHELGQNFAKNGPLDMVITSDLQRTHDTAHAVANGAPVVITPHLRDIDYGSFTGAPTRDVISTINKRILKQPEQPIDGANGESFNHYKNRLLNVTKLAINTSNQYPEARIGLVVNRRSIKTIQGWLSNHRTDEQFNPTTATDADSGLKPGDIFKLNGHQEGNYSISKADSTKPLDPGIYLIRHGATAWNGESHASPEAALTQPQVSTQTPTNPRIRGLNDMIKNATFTS